MTNDARPSTFTFVVVSSNRRLGKQFQLPTFAVRTILAGDEVRVEPNTEPQQIGRPHVVDRVSHRRQVMRRDRFGHRLSALFINIGHPASLERDSVKCREPVTSSERRAHVVHTFDTSCEVDRVLVKRWWNGKHGRLARSA
jgi:hypothetical protein